MILAKLAVEVIFFIISARLGTATDINRGVFEIGDQYENKLCFIILGSMTTRLPDNTTVYSALDTEGKLFKALTRYQTNGNNFTYAVEGNVETTLTTIGYKKYNASVNYCEYMRIMKLHKGPNLTEYEQTIINEYNEGHLQQTEPTHVQQRLNVQMSK